MDPKEGKKRAGKGNRYRKLGHLEDLEAAITSLEADAVAEAIPEE